MENKSVPVTILESTPDFLKVKLPFADIPIQMNHKFFKTRLEKGYFKVQSAPENHSFGNYSLH